MATKAVSVAEIFDNNRFTTYQMRVCFACFLVVLLEGFDLMVIGVAAPKIAQTLHISPSALGLAIGAGQLGPLIGAAGLGTLADRFGRKRMLVISALLCGLFTLATTQIANAEQLAICRFLSGIGIGGAVPNALSFGCEYAPSRMRSSLTTMMWAGMAFGSTIAGLIAAAVLPRHGWPALFWIGGIPPLLIAVLVALALPESLAFLARQGTDKAQMRRIVARIAPSLANDPQVEFYSSEQKLSGVPVKHLFSEGRASTTLLLWVLFFLSFYLIWVLLSWTPTFLSRTGASVQQASIAFALLNFGSALATIAIGRLMDRFDAFGTLTATCLLAFVSTAVFGALAGSGFVVVAGLAVVTGFFVFGANSGLMALGTISYPVSIRGSGVGWAYAVGKIGSIAAPVVGGVLLSLNWGVGRICLVNGATGILMAAAIIVLQRHTASRRLEQAELAITPAAE